MKYNLDTKVSCWDYSFKDTNEKEMTIGEFLNTLKNLDEYTEPYVQNEETINKWLEQGYIVTDEISEHGRIRMSNNVDNTIEIWYEYTYDDGCGGDVDCACSYITLPS